MLQIISETLQSLLMVFLQCDLCHKFDLLLLQLTVRLRYIKLLISAIVNLQRQ